MSTGVERIAAERARQLSECGYSEEHDDMHEQAELAYAATCYATPPWARADDTIRDMWPWPPAPERLFETARFSARDKTEDLLAWRRDIEKAGALCAAEIDRVTRLLERGGDE